MTITNTLEKNLAVESERVGNIELQLKDISSKLDTLITTVTENNIDNIHRYNELSQRLVSLEASKEQTKYIITIISILLIGLDFLLKYII